MKAWQLLTDHSQFMLAGASAFLCVGLLLSLIYRAPIQRKRAAEWAAASCLLFAVLSLAPLPRAWAAATETGTTGTATSTQMSAWLSPGLFEVANSANDAPVPELGSETSAPASSTTAAATSSLPEPAATRTPATSAEPTSTVTINWNAWLLRLYSAGAVIAATWLFIGWVRLRFVLRRATVVARRDSRPLLPLSAQRHRPRLLISAHATRPFCTGGSKPRIVIPQSLWQTGDERTKRHVIAHECAHIQQRDARGQWLFAVLQPLMWFHPLFWWLRSRHQLVTELIADDIAAGQSSKHSYAQDLVRLVEIDLERRQRPRGAVALFRKPSDFYQRIQMLMSRPERLATRCSWLQRSLQGGLSLALLVGATSLGGAQPVLAQEPDHDPSQEHIQALAQENMMLRQQLADMEAHLADMQARMDQVNQRMSGTDDSAGVPMLKELPLVGELFESGYTVLDEQGRILHDARIERVAGPGGPAVYREYTVRAGDSLWSIVKRAGLNPETALQQVITLNPEIGRISPDRSYFEVRPLRVGEKVVMPLTNMGGIGSTFDEYAPIPTPPAELQAAAPTREPTLAPAIASVSLAEAMEVSFRYIDLQAELELSEAKLEHSRHLAESGLVGGDEIHAAEIRLKAQLRKASIARRVIELKIDEYATQLDQLEEHHPQARQLESALQLLTESL